MLPPDEIYTQFVQDEFPDLLPQLERWQKDHNPEFPKLLNARMRQLRDMEQLKLDITRILIDALR